MEVRMGLLLVAGRLFLHGSLHWNEHELLNGLFLHESLHKSLNGLEYGLFTGGGPAFLALLCA